jgi:adenylate kinase
VNFVVLGPQGSGKSTQAKLLAGYFKLPHISTGDIFRRLENEDSDLGRRIKSKLSEGLLVADADVSLVLGTELSLSKYSHGVVLDGCPRNLAQAEKFPLKFDKVIYLKVSDAVGTDRLLKRQREDDTLEIIKERLLIYHQETEPVLDFYRQQGLFVEVNGEQSIDDIFEEIQQRLAK